jgi:predicted nuclease with RNAse H fold
VQRVSSDNSAAVARRRSLGLDLGGAASRSTGAVLLEEARRPARVALEPEPQVLPRARTPAEADERLLALVRDARPDVVAIDAPLTLPPCLRCSAGCRGPGVDRCERADARGLWRAGWNPTSQRLCELLIYERVRERPMPTMQLGALTARALVLARRFRRLRPPPRVLEVYPRATLAALHTVDSALRPRERTEGRADHRRRVVRAMRGSGLIEVPDRLRRRVTEEHVFDALVAAYTGWLYPSGLRPPPSMMRESDGWIWIPT